MKVKSDPHLSVKVVSPTQIFYDGPAVTVSATNRVGPFDILENHANFFSLITEGDILINTGVQELRFPVTHGIVKASKNVITLFIYLPDE